ncbi:MAG: tripartite tricarboxylate transporter TctB family protein [Alphaproteobacteria bacterium]|nr:tripartite tricarboxylate transporter TctB family protein [Alphaproteobacteria bacterium]
MKRVFGTSPLEYLPSLGLLVVTLGYLAQAYGYAPESRLVPAGVAWAMTALLVLDLVARSRTRLGGAVNRWLNSAAMSRGAQSDDAARPLGRQIAAVLWVAGFTLTMALIGILAAVPLYVFASLRLRGRRPFGVCLAVSAGTGLLIWLLFAVVLRIDLYPGLLATGL